jgi:hypothetical protein
MSKVAFVVGATGAAITVSVGRKSTLIARGSIYELFAYTRFSGVRKWLLFPAD